MTATRLLTSCVCSGCGSLCDDIDVALRQDRIETVYNACQWGLARFLDRKKFSSGLPRRRLAGARVQGEGSGLREVSIGRALEQAGELLEGAGRIVVYGLCQMSQEAYRPLFAFLRGRPTLFIPSEGPLWTTYLKTLRTHALPPAATLEEVRNQADFILFWGANPVHSLPRLTARYALFARGRYTERGIEDRRAFTVDVRTTEMARISEMITIEPSTDLALLEALSRASAGESVGSVPVPKKIFKALVDALERSHYRALFVGRGPFYGPHQDAFMNRFADWAVQLNRQAPTVLIPLASDFNTAGFYQEYLREDGFAEEGWHMADDLTGWIPRERDVLLAVSGDCLWFMEDAKRDLLLRHSIPIISLSVYENRTTASARAAVGVAAVGLDAGGCATRLDGVAIALEPIRPGPAPTDAQVLKRLAGADEPSDAAAGES